MEGKTRVGIVGYGNLGKGVDLAIRQNIDMELVAIFTRRPIDIIESYDEKVRVFDIKEANNYVDDIDVVILCGGSSTDIPVQGPYFASMYNTVDGYDNHGNIPQHIKAMDKASREGKKVSAVCLGWDPGLFSMNRVLFDAILPQGKTYTFWGPGVSQGHSDAVRRIAGVKNAIQYTVPNEKAVERIRSGETPELMNRERHRRDCYVVAEEYADKEEITDAIKSMPNYFEDYDTSVTFITEEELIENHSKLFHGGFVARGGRTGKDYSNSNIGEFNLKLDNNSEFTASVLVAYARAVHRLRKEGCTGVKTILDIPLKYISNKSLEDLYKNFL
ncbi:MAG: diaminopimelate dehydrogenase [Tissierellales bacterium]